MNRNKKIYVMLTAIFGILTFIGAGYVLYNKGTVNAGYAVIPSLFCALFSILVNIENNGDKKNKIGGKNEK